MIAVGVELHLSNSICELNKEITFVGFNDFRGQLVFCERLCYGSTLAFF